MKRLIVLFCICLIPISCFSADFFTSGNWRDYGNNIYIQGLSVQYINSIKYYKVVDLTCDDQICEMKSAILSNIGTNNEIIWNVSPLYQTYNVISFDESFIIAKNGAGTILRISRKNKNIKWIFWDNTFQILTNQNEINKILLHQN